MRWFSRWLRKIRVNKRRLKQTGMALLVLSPFLIAGIYYIGGFRYTYLKNIEKRGEVVFVTRNSPTTLYERQDGKLSGFEHDLAIAFAKYLKIKPRFVIEDSIPSILSAVSTGKADIAAAGLTKTELRRERFLFGPAYQEVQQQVVCRRNNNGVPKNIADLAGKKLVVAAGTSYVERLQQLKKRYPELTWKVDHKSDTELLLWKVWKRKIDCTVSDSNIAAINQRYYPELYTAFNISGNDALAWAIPRNAGRLQSALDDWMEDFIASGKLKVLLERYYGHLDDFDYVDTRRFRNKIQTVFPKYRKTFQSAARKHGLDWILLAAVSYQESHWNPRAKSPTGVRGMMMLTLTTASQMGVKSRLDARENIRAGAKYLAGLRDRLPDSIKEPDRTWMALAAYNLGYGHLQDARDLTKLMNKNPNRWIDVESVLPLLSQKRYYKILKHGYSRGYEAVQYVDRIREYRAILHKYMLG